MLGQIMIEAETRGDSLVTFRLRVGMNVIAERLSAMQAHHLAGEILDRISAPSSTVAVDTSALQRL